MVATPIDAMVKGHSNIKKKKLFWSRVSKGYGAVQKGDPKKKERKVEKEEIVILDF